MTDNKGQIIIYVKEDGRTQIDVKLQGDSLWLSQRLISELFEKDVNTINDHIRNIYSEKELAEDSTTAIFQIKQQEGKRKVNRSVTFYNLDLILSVGYRVNSKKGTAFRIWASRILKDYLLRGYSLNEKKLQEKVEQYEALKKAVTLINNVTGSQLLSENQATGLLRVLSDYTYALEVLDKYDHQILKIEATSPKQLFQITYHSAMQAISGLKERFGGSSLFGNEKDESFQGSLAAIYQTFSGEDLYPSVEEKAANLLYFVIKNHSFSDGNKRIAAFLFVWFLEKNGILYHSDGSRKLADNALVALTLMIAESKPEEKEMMTKVVVSLINSKN